jgi:hypothetical protein
VCFSNWPCSLGCGFNFWKGRVVGRTREFRSGFRSDVPSFTWVGGATELKIRSLRSARFMPNFLMDLEDNRHSLIACKKYFDGVPTLPLGAMDGGLNSDKLLRSIVEEVFSGKVKHIEDNSSSSRSVQCFLW